MRRYSAQPPWGWASTTNNKIYVTHPPVFVGRDHPSPPDLESGIETSVSIGTPTSVKSRSHLKKHT